MRGLWYFGKGAWVVRDGAVVHFSPYFYAVGRGRPRLKSASWVEETDLTSMEFDGLRYVPADGRVWAVYVERPSLVPKAREELLGMGYGVSQSYIKFALRAAGDLSLKSGPPDISAAVVESMYARPKVLAFDVEVAGGRVYVGYTVDGEDVAIVEVEKEKGARESDLPGDFDYAVGYNSWQFDWLYLPSATKYTLKTARGYRPHIDLFPLFAGGFGPSLGLAERSYGLYDVARQLGVHRELGLADVELLRIKRLRSRLAHLSAAEAEEYLATDVKVTYRLAARVVAILEGLGAAVGGNAMVVAQVGETASPGHLFEFLIHKEMERLGYVLVDRRKEAEYAAGDKVRVRAAGVFRNVAEYDFSAMYPSLIAQDGVDPTSVLECSDGFEVKTTGGSRRVCFEGGPIWRLHVAVLEARRAVKAVGKAADQAVKILANSGFGIYGKKAGWGVVNEWVAAYIVQKTDAIHADLWQRYKPVYGDTDSLYVQVGDPEAFLEEINAYVADKWRGPFGARLGLKLEGVWDYLWIPVTEKGTPAEKNYVKVGSGEVAVRGAALRLRGLPVFLRYGEFYQWAKALITGTASVSELLAKMEELPLEDLFIEASATLREVLFTREGKPPKALDASRQPWLALLAARHAKFTAKYNSRGVETSPDEDLDAVESLWYLPVSTRGNAKAYILLIDGSPVAVEYTADIDPVRGRLEVKRRIAVPMAPEQVRKRAKAVMLSHPLFAQLSQRPLVDAPRLTG